MAMTNAGLKELIAEVGERIFVFVLDNNKKVFFNVDGGSPENAIHVESLLFKTIGGTDFFGVPRSDKVWGNGGNPQPVKYVHWMGTEFIQSIGVTDELGENLPDLNKWY